MTRKVKTVARDTTMRELHKMFEAIISTAIRSAKAMTSSAS
jgi:hypothetical protein